MTLGSSGHRLRQLSVVPALTLALLCAAAGPAAAAAAPTPSAPSPAPKAGPRVTFGIGPAGPERADERPFLAYGVTPGSQVMDHVAVVNQSDVPLTLLVYAGDGLNAEGGGLDITKRADRNVDLGAWVTLGKAATSGRLDPTSRSATTVTVPPQDKKTGRGTVIVPVRFAVPADASPGDHVGGIAVSLVSRGNNRSSQNLELEQRVVARVYLRVAGPLRPKLSVDVLDASYAGQGRLGRTGTVRLTYRIANDGNTRLGASSRVDVAGLFGVAARIADGAVVDELVPGGEAVLTTLVENVPPLGLVDAAVTVRAVPPPGGALTPAPEVTASTRLLVLTWQLRALLALLLLAVLAVVVLLRRRRRARWRPGPAEPYPSGPTGSRRAAAATRK